MPVNKKAHQTQFPETPFVRTISVTRFGVSAEKVVATIEIPSNHQGIFLPERKNSLTLFPAFFDAQKPIDNNIMKNAARIYQSRDDNCILNNYLLLNVHY